jgi:hypothetical protein
MSVFRVFRLRAGVKAPQPAFAPIQIFRSGAIRRAHALADHAFQRDGMRPMYHLATLLKHEILDRNAIWKRPPIAAAVPGLNARPQLMPSGLSAARISSAFLTSTHSSARRSRFPLHFPPSGPTRLPGAAHLDELATEKARAFNREYSPACRTDLGASRPDEIFRSTSPTTASQPGGATLQVALLDALTSM